MTVLDGKLPTVSTHHLIEPGVLSDVFQFHEVLMGVVFSLAALAGILTTSGLCWYLSSQRTGFDQCVKYACLLNFLIGYCRHSRRTDHLLQRMIVFFVSRGLLITLTEVTYLAVFLASPSTALWWVSLCALLSRDLSYVPL